MPPRSASSFLAPLVVALLAPRALPPADDGDARAAGLRALRTVPMQSFGLTEDRFADLWTVWPEPARSAAEAASPGERRALAFERYGLFVAPDTAPADVPVAFSREPGSREWRMSCLACHAGRVDGEVVLGAPGNELALRTLFEDITRHKLRSGARPSRQEVGMALFPLGDSDGTTNAQLFSVVLATFRDADLELIETPRPLGTTGHHDLDAPPLWNVRHRSRLYLDGYAEKSHRVVMQFALGLDNDGTTVRALESEFEDVLAWVEGLEAPRWPGAIDGDLARRGHAVFDATCARCHGEHAEDGALVAYPEERVPVDFVGTDPVRATAIPRAFRAFMAASWLSGYGDVDIELDPGGYVAPPLVGVWASAPYLHNGAVPTLWGVLRPDERPEVWRPRGRDDGRGHAYDRAAVGLEHERGDAAAVRAIDDPAERRRWFDGTRRGKSVRGHRFAADLSDADARALLEFLKRL